MIRPLNVIDLFVLGAGYFSDHLDNQGGREFLMYLTVREASQQWLRFSKNRSKKLFQFTCNLMFDLGCLNLVNTQGN